MSTLRISDAPLLPDVDGTEKIPTGGRGDYAISVDQIKGHIFQDIGKELVGLGNVDNTSDLDKPVSTAQQAALDLKADKIYVDTNLDLKADKTNVYTRSETTLALSQKADLVGGVIPENQIPSSFNDVLEFTTSNLPVVGESGKIYVTTDNNKTWRWGGNQYVEISNGGISDSTLKLQTPRKISNVDFDGTQNIEIPHNNLVNRDVVGAHPSSAILDARGISQQGINDLSLTPYHFGAIGDGTSHKLSERYATLAQAKAIYPHAVSLDDEIDWCAIQKFADLYVASADNRNISFDMSGHFFVNRTCDFTIKNGTMYAGAYKCISGDHYFTVRSDFLGKTVLAFNGRGSVLTGITYIKGGNFVDYGVIFADKTQPDSITTAIAFGQGGFKIFVDNVRIRAVEFDTTAMFASVELIRGYDCGKAFELTATSITNRTVNSLDTRSDIVLSSDIALPDLIRVNVFVTRGRDVAKVVSYEPATRKLEVKNAFTDTSTSGTIKLYYGGLVGIRGSDSAGIKLGVCSGVYTPTVVDNSSMYTVDIVEVVSEFSHCTIYDEGLVGGLKIGTAYYEGDTWQYISNNASSATYGFTNIGKTTGFNIDKYTSILFPKNAEGYGAAGFDGLQGVQITEKDIIHRYEKPAYNENTGSTFIDLNTPFEVFNRQFNSGTIQFRAVNKQYNKLFGYDLKQVVIHGTGVDGIPTGNITFRPPTGWTINGGTVDVVFSGFTGPAKFDIKLRPATNDINITCSNLRSINLSNQSAIPSAYTNANDLPVDTKYWFSNGTTVANLPIPTSGSQSNGNIETYYSYNKVGSAHNKTQVVEYPTLYEKWERVFSSGSGSYGVWKLKDYEVKKGTTAQRPSNPQLGMRYYDTTLLAAGKPIEWNGAIWVDAIGVAV